MKKLLVAVFAILAIGTFATASFASRSGDGSGSRCCAAGGNTGDQNHSYNDNDSGFYQGRGH